MNLDFSKVRTPPVGASLLANLYIAIASKLAPTVRSRSKSSGGIRLSQKGFTLLEVLVALVILAVTMAAVSRTASSSIHHADAMRIRVIADWVAQNRLAQHQARGDYPQPGIQTGSEEQAGQTYPWREEIIATPNPTMRRIIVNVYAPEDKQHSLRELTGYLVQCSRSGGIC
jgi:general secretion pathway protein I